MQVVSRVSVLLAVISLLPACGKSVAPEAAVKPSGEAVKAQQQEAFGLSGELLTVNVDGMAQADFLAKLGQLTGSQISSEGAAGTPITVHVDQASLRKVLSLAIADAPYTVTMQYTNLQDSFPARVTVSRYGAASAGTNGMQPITTQRPVQPTPAESAEPQMDSADMVATAPEVDMASMPEEEKLAYFISQNADDQASLIFDMEPTPEDAALMAKLMAKAEVSNEVKMEMLDSLSNGEYGDGIPALKIAVESTDPGVATRAIEVIGEMGDARDVPMLKKIAEEHADQSVREAAKDAFETLE
jgi:hypothetical protein